MYSCVAIGGSFDYLHKGHRVFLLQACKAGKRVLIGLTSDKYLFNKLQNNSQFQNFQTRKKEIVRFLHIHKRIDRAKIFQIDDVYGGLDKTETVEAIVVTPESISGARLINKKRKENNVKPLEMISVPLVLAQDQKPISSTRVRMGEIDREGNVYILRIRNREIKITQKMREMLGKPLGKFIEGDPRDLKAIIPDLKKHLKLFSTGPATRVFQESLQSSSNDMHSTTDSHYQGASEAHLGSPSLASPGFFSFLITIGDEVTKLVNTMDLPIGLAVVDFIVERKKKYEKLSDLGFTNSQGSIQAINPAGVITPHLTVAVYTGIQKYVKTRKMQIVQVVGEEDLAGIPAILFAPLGSIVLYGQPGRGVIAVRVTESKKRQIQELIKLSRRKSSIYEE